MHADAWFIDRQTPALHVGNGSNGYPYMLRRRNLIVAATAFLLGLMAALLYLREPTTPFTQEALAQARQRWRNAGIRTYRATYRMHGSLYEVEVRDGLVAAITVNGQTPSIALPSAYSIDGLLDTLQTELENINDSASSLGTAPGTVVARVRFDDLLGYPQRYIRGGTGLGRGSTLEMLEFQPAGD